MIYNFDTEFIKNEMEKKKKIFLHDIGEAAQNQAASLAPYDTGALRNSIIYKLHDGTGSKMGSKYGKAAPSDAEISPSDNIDYVKIGSALKYAAVREARGKGAGYMSSTLDYMTRVGTLQKIAERSFQW